MKTINTSKKRHWMALATALTLAGAALPTYAGEGHDHGAAPATANANGPQRMADGSVFSAQTSPTPTECAHDGGGNR